MIRHSIFVWAIGVATGGLLCVLPLAARAVSFRGLGDLPGWEEFSEANAISADGSVVVGVSFTGPDSRRGTIEAFRWSADTGMVGLGTLSDSEGSSTDSVANGVSADGSVIVGETVQSGGSFRAFRWNAAQGMVGFPDLASGFSSIGATGVSADGSVIVGFGEISSALHEAWRWDAANGTTLLGDLPGAWDWSGAGGVSADGRIVVGSGSSESGSQAVRWDSLEGIVELNDRPPRMTGGSQARAISGDGSVVVGNYDNSWPFRWDAATGMVLLDILHGGAFQGRALAVSADGAVIVGDTGTGLAREAFIWDATHGMRELDVLLTLLGVDLTGWTLMDATGVSADGLTITGNGIDPDGNREAWVAVIPEPGTGFLMGLGLVLLTRLRRTS